MDRNRVPRRSRSAPRRLLEFPSVCASSRCLQSVVVCLSFCSLSPPAAIKPTTTMATVIADRAAATAGRPTGAVRISRTASPTRHVLAANEACRSDDQCPCGTACANGQCRAQCTSSGDCSSDQRCDTFGRCRAKDDTSTLSALSPKTAGGLTVTPPYIEAPADLATTIAISASGNAIANARVAAGWRASK